MPAISFQSVSKTFKTSRGAPGPAVQALDQVSFYIHPGEFFFLLFPHCSFNTSFFFILSFFSLSFIFPFFLPFHDVFSYFSYSLLLLFFLPLWSPATPVVSSRRSAAAPHSTMPESKGPQ